MLPVLEQSLWFLCSPGKCCLLFPVAIFLTNEWKSFTCSAFQDSSDKFFFWIFKLFSVLNQTKQQTKVSILFWFASHSANWLNESTLYYTSTISRIYQAPFLFLCWLVSLYSALCTVNGSQNSMSCGSSVFISHISICFHYCLLHLLCIDLSECVWFLFFFFSSEQIQTFHIIHTGNPTRETSCFSKQFNYMYEYNIPMLLRWSCSRVPGPFEWTLLYSWCCSNSQNGTANKWGKTK